MIVYVVHPLISFLGSFGNTRHGTSVHKVRINQAIIII